MPVPLQEVASKALGLSPEERAELAHELILSLDEVEDREVERAWDAEVERRVQEIRSGKAKGRPAEDILAEIRARYS
jgi:putative addiction module component (TIGR02574 family)